MASCHTKCTRTTKPEWLKIRTRHSEKYAAVSSLVEQFGLHTICSSGKCPNISECWSASTATFLIGGGICTRCCKFCATPSGVPLPLDDGEPQKIARSVEIMGIKHAVITSVDRDDLADGGAMHWKRTVEAVSSQNPGTTIEVLIPDFDGREDLLDVILSSGADIIGHNIETVERVSPLVRSRATYARSLGVLRYLSERGAETKSGLMVGLGETFDEVIGSLQDLYNSGVRRATIGQYLQPTRSHYGVCEYITPEVFDRYAEVGKEIGFTHIVSGPLVRSSYHAEL